MSVPPGQSPEYVADNYGTCDRGTDCYHGKDSRGQPDGCHRTGWKGRACPHWHPVTWEELQERARDARG